MPEHGTASRQVPGWYVEFQMAVLRALPRDINQDTADGWRANGEALAKAFRGVLIPQESKKREKPKLKLLLSQSMDIAAIPTRNDEFVVRKDFAKYRGSNFDNWFLGKAEEPIAETVLCSQQLLQSSTDPAIIAELGGYLKARITLADINYAKENGALRKDVVYIGYVEDKVRFPADEAFSYTNEKGEKSVLRAVYFYWRDDGWDVFANSVGSPREWSAGIQLLSRNSGA